MMMIISYERFKVVAVVAVHLFHQVVGIFAFLDLNLIN